MRRRSFQARLLFLIVCVHVGLLGPGGRGPGEANRARFPAETVRDGCAHANDPRGPRCGVL